MAKRREPPHAELRVRNHLAADPPFADVWLLWVDGAAESCMLHGELSPEAVERVVGVMNAAGVEVDLLESLLPVKPLRRPAPPAGPVQAMLPGAEG